MKITLVKGIGFIINLVWTGWGQEPADRMDPCLPLGCEELYCGSTIEGSLQGCLVEEGGKLSLRESWEQSLIRPDP